MTYKRIKDPYNSRTYQQEKVQLAFDYAPRIYPCGTCGHPVADGYCCTTCGSTEPYEKASAEE